ncbi:hypothetical protein BC832DRAFT_536953 [Gaertneriomyces semiglobifer]|nr:hypothetical protein BC832DRAFT_536953 [Gaertneriomyces semiglobifer]
MAFSHTHSIMAKWAFCNCGRCITASYCLRNGANGGKSQDPKTQRETPHSLPDVCAICLSEQSGEEPSCLKLRRVGKMEVGHAGTKQWWTENHSVFGEVFDADTSRDLLQFTAPPRRAALWDFGWDGCSPVPSTKLKNNGRAMGLDATAAAADKCRQLQEDRFDCGMSKMIVLIAVERLAKRFSIGNLQASISVGAIDRSGHGSNNSAILEKSGEALEDAEWVAVVVT